tara:strand:+ start:1572 stop:1796 length:225 start_codon:yes stop_codon:yes gene_type:complete
MSEHTISMSCRIDELPEQHQVTIVHLVNHLASLPGAYQENAMGRLAKIAVENPWQDDIEGLEKFPLHEEDFDYE